jgi:diguanylate cyclase
VRVVSCLFTEHNLWLVALAAAICVIGCVVSVDLWRRSLASSPGNGLSWSFLAGVTAGASIWATHFIAMLGYQVEVPVSFDPALTIASIVTAIAGTTLGIALTNWRRGRTAALLGGAIFGLSVAAMHYVGMFAYRAEGVVSWDAGYVAASLAAATGISALAGASLRRWQSGLGGHAAAALFVVAIVSLHFTGMAAFAVTPMPGVSAGAGDAFVAMAMSVALVALIIVGAGLASRGIDTRTRTASEEQLRFNALHDALTGLPNRRQFNEALSAYFAGGAASGQLSLLIVDLDRFKPVNDSYGHPVGDEVLRRIARRLKAAANGDSLVGRLGGDEFGVLARTGEAAALALAERVVDVLARPILLDGNVMEVGASVGVAHAHLHGASATELTQNADVALYAAKEAGRGMFCVFNDAMNEKTRLRRALEAGLRRAVAREEFELFYQPQVDAASGRPSGAEALIRWTHSELGSISPSVFVPLAEELGLIGPIGTWVLRTACAHALEWPAGTSLAVNLSAQQLADPRLPLQVAEILADTGFPASRLELEITETAIVGNHEMALENLRKLKEQGIVISLDDFGTGYSSLTYLHQFPIDRIKIDRSFIQSVPHDAGSMSIVRAIAGLGASLGMGIIAEGIETEEQMRFSTQHGCGHLQGYLFSKPVAALDISRLFAEPHAGRAVTA